MTTNVLIAGGGPAGLEAALALHRLAGDRVATTVLAPEAEFNYRPLSVLAPFAEAGILTYPLERFALDAGFTQVRDRLASVDPDAHAVETATGESLHYDALLVALGARAVAPPGGGVVFAGVLDGVYAAGDATAFEVKHGRIACQMPTPPPSTSPRRRARRSRRARSPRSARRSQHKVPDPLRSL
jgi:NAD(P)H-nitrite reductase large subunit